MTGSRDIRKRRNKSAMSIGQKLLPLLIMDVIWGLRGIAAMLAIIVGIFEEEKTEDELFKALNEVTSMLVTNAIFISLLVFTKIFD